MACNYEEIYSPEDQIKQKPHGWIQWKGTDVCIDIHCECGESSHYDGEFMYAVECPHCERQWVVGQCVQLIPFLPAYEDDFDVKIATH